MPKTNSFLFFSLVLSILSLCSSYYSSYWVAFTSITSVFQCHFLTRDLFSSRKALILSYASLNGVFVGSFFQNLIRSSLHFCITFSSFSISEKVWCSLNSPTIGCFSNLFGRKDCFIIERRDLWKMAIFVGSLFLV